MIRFLLTLLWTLGFLWAALDGVSAEGAAGASGSTTAKLTADGRRLFGPDGARIMIAATDDSWVRVRDAAGKVAFMRIMKRGDVYRVPNRPGFVMDTGNGNALILQVDGKRITLEGFVHRDIRLDPPLLLASKSSLGPPRSLQPEAAPARTTSPDASGVGAETASKASAPTTTVPTTTAPTTAVVSEPLAPLQPEPQPAAATASAKPAASPKRAAPDPVEAEQRTAMVQPAPVVRRPAPATVTAAPINRPAPTISAVTPARAARLVRPPPPRPRAAEPAVMAAPAVANGARIAVEVNKGTILRLSRPAGAVFLADPDVADIQMRSASLVYLLGKRPGETVLFAVDERERVILNTTIVVEHNVRRISDALRAVVPDARLDVTAVDSAVLLTGTVASATEAESAQRVARRFVAEEGAIINQIQVAAPNQINLRVRVAEVSREMLKSFGINWESMTQSGNFLIGWGVNRDFVDEATGRFMRTGTDNSVFARLRTGSVDINAAIDALATEGLVTVLAEPNLTAMTGETASFLAGGEFPIPLVLDDELTIQFKQFGVSLAFTPQILGNSRINLRVKPEVSQLSTAGAVQIGGFTIPALTTRRAETTVELGSGQSFVIAGLLQNNTSQDVARLPGLGDLPILGALFRSEQFRRNETELVIIVTPYVVRPVSATQLASPTDGFVAPSDIERIVGGVTYRQQMPKGDDAPRLREGRGLIGPVGFVLE